ncbi:hypothetical protein TanjilG_23791 [Lupinus angustifolius]|nr:hypothetical protein TanjilG_23791 [Lupinus angustifolius]
MDNCHGKVNYMKVRKDELVGVKGEVAASIMKKENPRVREVRIVHDILVIPDLICDRVWVWVDDNGFVKRVPMLG